MWSRLLGWSKWRTVSFTSGADILKMLLSVVSGILTARLLLPQGKGELTAILLWHGLFSNVGNIGMPHAVIYYTGQNEEEVGRVFGTATAIALVQGAAVAVAGYFAIEHIIGDYGKDVVRTARTMFIFAPISFLYSYSIRTVQGVGNYNIWNIFRVAQSLIYVSVIVLLWILEEMNVQSVVYGYVLSQFSVAIFCSYYVISGAKKVDFDFGLVRKFMSYGSRNWLAGMAGQANARIDQGIISMVLSSELLGFYRVAVSATRPIGVVSGGFSKIILPEVSLADEGKREKIRKSLYIAGGLLVVSAGIGVLLIPYVLPFLFGAEYTSAIFSAQILCVAMTVMGMRNILNNGVRGLGYPQYPLYGEVTSLVVTAAGLWGLLPLLGIEGAAITSLLAYATGAAIVYELGLRRKPVEVG
ncbi:O-antigen/teichoic acid export membrane protein [Salinibacter ruber]|nr:O-antigen/teichoic acid export membrane protein [Salinibacter ruber]